MKSNDRLVRHLPPTVKGCPEARCDVYSQRTVVVCDVKGKARNKLYIEHDQDAVAFEADGSPRFPPMPNAPVCDWVVFKDAQNGDRFFIVHAQDIQHCRRRQ